MTVDRLPGDPGPRPHADRRMKCWCLRVEGAVHPTDPTTCVHVDFEAAVEISRLFQDPDLPTEVAEATMPDGLAVEVTARCLDCGEPLVFHGQGLRVGLLADQPTLSIDGTALRVPARPQRSDPLFGLGLAGFTMRASGAGGSGLN